MKRLRNLTAIVAIITILLGGIFGSVGLGGSRVLILSGAAVLLLGYIPLFLYDISKKWDDD